MDLLATSPYSVNITEKRHFTMYGNRCAIYVLFILSSTNVQEQDDSGIDSNYTSPVGFLRKPDFPCVHRFATEPDLQFCVLLVFLSWYTSNFTLIGDLPVFRY
jgi:hypothetical protein